MDEREQATTARALVLALEQSQRDDQARAAAHRAWKIDSLKRSIARAEQRGTPDDDWMLRADRLELAELEALVAVAA